MSLVFFYHDTANPPIGGEMVNGSQTPGIVEFFPTPELCPFD